MLRSTHSWRNKDMAIRHHHEANFDSPGVVPLESLSTANNRISTRVLLLRGALRVEKCETPAEHVHAAINRCKAKHVV